MKRCKKLSMQKKKLPVYCKKIYRLYFFAACFFNRE